MRTCEVSLLVPLAGSDDTRITLSIELPDTITQAAILPAFNTLTRAAIAQLVETFGPVGIEQAEGQTVGTEFEAEPIDNPNEFRGFSPLG